MESTSSAPPDNSSDPIEEKLSPYDNIIERMSLSGVLRSRITNATNYNLIVGGVIKCLKGFHEHPKAETLHYEEFPEENIEKRQDQCQKIVEALIEVDCPFKVEAHHFIDLDYAALAPMITWVLRKGLLLECEDNESKKYYSSTFYKTYEDGEAAFDEFRRRFTQEGNDLVRCVVTFDIFQSKIIGKNLTGRQIMGEYIVQRRIHQFDTDSDSDERPPTPDGMISKEITIPTADELFDKDPPVVAEYRDELCATIDSFQIDKELDELKKRIHAEAKSYYLTRKEFQNIEQHLFFAYARTEEFNETLVSQMMKELDNTMLRVQVFRNGVHRDFEATNNMVTKLKPELNDQGEEIEDPMKKDLYKKYCDFGMKFGSIITSCHGLTLRLNRMTADTLGSKEREARINAMKDSPDLSSQDYFLPIDSTISDRIVFLSHQIHKQVLEMKGGPPPEKKTAELYQQVFFNYVVDVLSKLSDWYWKADLLHHNRVAEKKRVEDRRADMRVKQRLEVKNAQIMRVVFDVNNTIQDINHTLDEHSLQAQEVKQQMYETIRKLSATSLS